MNSVAGAVKLRAIVTALAVLAATSAFADTLKVRWNVHPLIHSKDALEILGPDDKPREVDMNPVTWMAKVERHEDKKCFARTGSQAATLTGTVIITCSTADAPITTYKALHIEGNAKEPSRLLVESVQVGKRVIKGAGLQVHFDFYSEATVSE